MLRKGPGATGAKSRIHRRVIPAPRSVPARSRPITPSAPQKSEPDIPADVDEDCPTEFPFSDGAAIGASGTAGLSVISGWVNRLYPLRGMVSMYSGLSKESPRAWRSLLTVVLTLAS